MGDHGCRGEERHDRIAHAAKVARMLDGYAGRNCLTCQQAGHSTKGACARVMRHGCFLPIIRTPRGVTLERRTPVIAEVFLDLYSRTSHHCRNSTGE